MYIVTQRLMICPIFRAKTLQEAGHISVKGETLAKRVYLTFQSEFHDLSYIGKRTAPTPSVFLKWIDDAVP
jgi:hypothetical protein